MKIMEIEKRSLESIQEELGDRKLDPECDLLIRRVIHTTADFEYVDTIAFSEHAMLKQMDAIRNGCDIVTDTTMAMSGINKKSLGKFGSTAHCFIADADVAAEAKEHSVTRSLVSMERPRG